MRKSVILFAILVVTAVVLGQTAKTVTSKSPSASFSPHDLSGTWLGPDPQLPGPRFQEVFGPDVPPMTPWGKDRFDAAKPGFGPRANLNGNDPTLHCDPEGVPRILTYITPMEIIQAPGQIVELFEQAHEWRQIWTDGRKTPSDLAPTWNGYSVGKWEGNTLVVETVGFNDKSWMDQYGDPHSDAMRLIERYTRLDRHRLNLSMTIYDPKTYTKPWVGMTRPLTLNPGLDIEDEPCVPEEMENFTKTVRIPAAKPEK